MTPVGERELVRRGYDALSCHCCSNE